MRHALPLGINGSRYRGFTLVETMVALAVLAMMLLAVAPSIGSWLDNTRIRSASDAIQTGLQIARNEAIKRNQNVTFWLVSANANNTSLLDNLCALSDSSGSWVVSINDPTGQCAASSDTANTNTAPRLIDKRAAGDSGGAVTVSATHKDPISGVSTAANRVTFNGFGRVSNADTDTTITDITLASSRDNTARNLQLNVSTTGQIRVCDPHVSSDDPRACPSE